MVTDNKIDSVAKPLMRSLSSPDVKCSLGNARGIVKQLLALPSEAWSGNPLRVKITDELPELDADRRSTPDAEERPLGFGDVLLLAGGRYLSVVDADTVLVDGEAVAIGDFVAENGFSFVGFARGVDTPEGVKALAEAAPIDPAVRDNFSRRVKLPPVSDEMSRTIWGSREGTESLVVELPDGRTVDAPNTLAAQMLRDVLGGATGNEAVEAAGFGLTPGQQVDAAELKPGDVMVVQDRVLVVVAEDTVLDDGDLRPIADVLAAHVEDFQGFERFWSQSPQADEGRGVGAAVGPGYGGAARFDDADLPVRAPVLELRDVPTTAVEAAARYPRPLPIGVGSGGTEVVWDPSRTPHMLLCGATGSGIRKAARAVVTAAAGAGYQIAVIADEHEMFADDFAGLPNVIGRVRAEDAATELPLLAYNQMMWRYRRLSTSGADEESSPLLFVVSGEAYRWMSRDAAEKLLMVLRLGRAARTHVLVVDQRRDLDRVEREANPPVRDIIGEFLGNLTVRACVGNPSVREADRLFHTSAVPRLDPVARGRGIVGGDREPAAVEFYDTLADAELRRLVPQLY